MQWQYTRRSDHFLKVPGLLRVKTYELAGCAAVSRLASIAERFPSDSLLGWFTFRAGSWSQPSMREVAVCAGLPAALRLLPGREVSALQPLLFATLATESAHHGATANFRQQFYRVVEDAGRYFSRVAVPCKSRGAEAAG